MASERNESIVTTVIVSKLNSKRSKSKSSSVAKKRLRASDGRFVDVITLDADSRTFGSDLKYAFQKNVSKVRRDNKKRFGSPDRVVRGN
jgi:hypothetical protein